MISAIFTTKYIGRKNWKESIILWLLYLIITFIAFYAVDSILFALHIYECHGSCPEGILKYTELRLLLWFIVNAIWFTIICHFFSDIKWKKSIYIGIVTVIADGLIIFFLIIGMLSLSPY